MNINDVKKALRDKAKIETINPPKTGGQSCGITYARQRLYSEEFDITIETGYYRSNLKNRELLLELFEAAIDKLIF